MSLLRNIKKEAEDEDEDITTEETWLMQIKEETPSCLEDDPGFFKEYLSGARGVEVEEDDGNVEPLLAKEEEAEGVDENAAADSGLILTVSVKPEPDTARGHCTTHIQKRFRMAKKNHSDDSLEKGKPSVGHEEEAHGVGENAPVPISVKPEPDAVQDPQTTAILKRFRMANQNLSYESQNNGNASANQENTKELTSFPCQDCGMVFDEEKKSRAHRRAHSTFPCDLCGQICKNLVALSKHKEAHLEEKPHKCTRCDMSFFSEHWLQLHASSHDVGRKFACQICNKSYSNRCSLRAHVRAHQRIHVCRVCDKAFVSKSMLKTHASVHVEEKPFACDVCNSRFKYMQTLKLHKKLIHAEQKELLKCKFCPSIFKNEKYLKRHLKRHIEADSERRFRCTVCGIRFTTKRSLVSHGTTHTGERPFECDVCGKAFRQKSYLKEHKFLHTEDKSHVCTECGKGFKLRRALYNHNMRSHNKIQPNRVKCHHCSKSFAGKSVLKVHIRQRHTGERPYACDVCGKRFAGKSRVQAHVNRVHGNKKPPKCSK